MRRSIPSAYDDGLFTPRTKGKNGDMLKSPREISRVLHIADTSKDTENKGISHMTMQFAQFLDHDFTLSPIKSGAGGAAITCCDEDVPVAARDAGITVADRHQCFPIVVPPGDPRFKRSCLNFVRSIQVNNTNCNALPAEQMNVLTAYIDGSQIHGSTKEEQEELRETKGGLLKTSRKHPELLPRNPVPTCITRQSPNFCFLAGDERVNEHMALASMHTIWLREHNRIATELAKINSHWDDERLFQETRRIVGAMLQHITYAEFLPLVLSPSLRAKYNLNLVGNDEYSNIYDDSVDASIPNSFAAAAYRFGHSLIRSKFKQTNPFLLKTGKILLRRSFENTSIILESNGDAVDSLIRGLTKDRSMNVDRRFTPEVSNFLFPDSKGESQDLVSLNLQRGRDHGLPGYNRWREWCGLSTASNFETDSGGLVDHPNDAAKTLGELYSHPDDIDLFSGGVSENPVSGGLIGPTFSCIIARQFRALRVGDRFWYETGDADVRFTEDQLRELRRANLARVICENTNTKWLPREVLRTISFRNLPLPCIFWKLYTLNLRKWKEPYDD